MTKTNVVGRSSRTPFKHWILDAHLGRICGVLSTRSSIVPAKAEPFLCVDLCAGDGVETEDHRASPHIITKHCNFLATRGFDVQSVFIERDMLTHESLRANLPLAAERNYQQVISGDAREYLVIPAVSNQAIFVNCDPNNVANMPFIKGFADSLTPTTTVTMTLGCNAGGIKKLKREDREKWFEYVQVMVGAMPSFHDAILCSLKKDASQWAYLTRLPSKWAASEAASIEKNGNSMWPNGVEVVTFRRGYLHFADMVKRLFLTKEEYENELQPN